MKRFFFFCFLIFWMSGTAAAQLIQTNENAYREILKDSEGKPLKMDFSIPLTGISDQGMQFSLFSKRPLLIYFFSPKCVYCHNHFPEFQKTAKEYESQGVYSIAVTLGGGIRKNDIRTFMEELNVLIPVFQDESMKFSSLYGTGQIPVTYLILPDGTIYRYSEMTPKSKNQFISDIKALLKPKDN